MPDKFDKFNRASRDFILTQPVDMAAVNKLGWAELNVGWPTDDIEGVIDAHSFGSWQVRGRGVALTGAYLGRGKGQVIHIAPIPHPSELCDPANPLNRVVRWDDGKVVPPPGWRKWTLSEQATSDIRGLVMCAVGSHAWKPALMGYYPLPNQPDFLVPLHPSLPPFAPVASEKPAPTKATCVADLSGMNHGKLVAQARLFKVRHVGLSTSQLRAKIAAKIAPAEKVAAPAPKFKPGDRVVFHTWGSPRVVESVRMNDDKKHSDYDGWVYSGHHFVDVPEDMLTIELAPSPAPFAWPEIDPNVSMYGMPATMEAYKSPMRDCRVLSKAQLSAAKAEMERLRAENERLEKANAALLERNAKLEKRDDELTSHGIDIVARLESSLASARADAEKLRTEWQSLRASFWSRNDHFRHILRRVLLEPNYAKEMLDGELKRMYPDPPIDPTIPDPTKEADRGDKS